MAHFSRLTNSLLSATNENTLALASFNLDFSLIKLEAPKEFQGLGSTLSKQRRNNAEDGPLHKTLRRLGCLFEQVVPSTPELIKAYGLRSSEIIQAPGISPKGSKSDGPFEAFVGADGTSIWAAATSGPAAMGVHLLACMLARQFDDAKISTAIWVEIVLERQLEIQAAIEKNHVVSMATIIAARQDISREELAIFDASARAWLCSADEAKASNQKKLMLILRNINIPVSGGSSTYSKVIEAWKHAMTGFEDLLNGMPQQVSNGAILRALSSWYLYPNLIVLVEQTVHVKFEDPLFPQQSVLTVGLQSFNPAHSEGIRWSLTLSHLRYYGDPIPVDSNENNSRVDIHQLHIIAFGSFLEAWGISPKDTVTAAIWFRTLWNQLETSESTSIVPLVERLPWLNTLVTTANKFLDSQGNDLETSQLLINYGRRRGQRFLSKPGKYHRPFFGLDNIYVSNALTADSDLECGIRYFREVAKSIPLGQYGAVIVYTENFAESRYWELATAIPHLRPSLKRLQDGSARQEQVHARWIYSRLSFPSQSHLPCNCQDSCSYSCKCQAAGLFCGRSCHEGRKGVCQAQELESRIKKLSDRGEEVHLIKVAPVHANTDSEGTIQWPGSPAIYDRESRPQSDSNKCRTWTSASGCRCFNTYTGKQIGLKCLAGNAKHGFALYAESTISYEQHHFIRCKVSQLRVSKSDPAAVLQTLSTGAMNLSILQRYLDFIEKNDVEVYSKGSSKISRPRVNEQVGGFPAKADINPSGHLNLRDFLHAGYSNSLKALLQVLASDTVPLSLLRSLWALSFARRVYDRIPTASISLKIIERPLHDYTWIPPELRVPDSNSDKNRDDPSRSQVFACIATFESGGLLIDPDELDSVMAISSRNSIFVAGVLLSDPAERTEGIDVRRVVGNVGQPGITLMISPQNLLIKPPNRDFREVKHIDYNYQRIDSFSGTSLHLSFTKWKLPLSGGDYGLIDQDIFMAEAVIQVLDSGRWVADIDVLAAQPQDYHPYTDCDCRQPSSNFKGDFVSVDSWEELLDPPLTFSIIRAHGNWAARLAAICVMKQKNMAVQAWVVNPKTCLTCLEAEYWSNERTSSFFID